MALHPRRLQRALSLSYSLLDYSFHGCKAKPMSSTFASRVLPSPAMNAQLMPRSFTSTTALFRRPFDPERDEIGPDTILFEGCDYNHWLITVDFPKDSNISREQMIETYVNIAAQVFGSVEEAKKKIYALSTTTYQGFQVECSEATSEKFKSIPAVVFVLPDSYLDPVNKEYGGDKYVNGEIFPRPPPVHYGRRPREQNYGPPPQQNYGSPRQQNYGPPRQQNYGPPRPPLHQNYGPPPQQNFQNSPQPNYVTPSSQNYASPQQQNYRAPQGYTPQPHQNSSSPPQRNYMPNSQGSYGNSPNFPPQPNNIPAGPGERRGYAPPNNTPGHDGIGQGNFQNHAQPGAQGAEYRSSQDGAFGHLPGGRRDFSTSRTSAE